MSVVSPGSLSFALKWLECRIQLIDIVYTHTHSHSHQHSAMLVVMMRSKEIRTSRLVHILILAGSLSVALCQAVLTELWVADNDPGTMNGWCKLLER